MEATEIKYIVKYMRFYPNIGGAIFVPRGEVLITTDHMKFLELKNNKLYEDGNEIDHFYILDILNEYIELHKSTTLEIIENNGNHVMTSCNIKKIKIGSALLIKNKYRKLEIYDGDIVEIIYKKFIFDRHINGKIIIPKGPDSINIINRFDNNHIYIDKREEFGGKIIEIPLYDIKHIHIIRRKKDV